MYTSWHNIRKFSVYLMRCNYFAIFTVNSMEWFFLSSRSFSNDNKTLCVNTTWRNVLFRWKNYESLLCRRIINSIKHNSKKILHWNTWQQSAYLFGLVMTILMTQPAIYTWRFCHSSSFWVCFCAIQFFVLDEKERRWYFC